MKLNVLRFPSGHTPTTTLPRSSQHLSLFHFCPFSNHAFSHSQFRSSPSPPLKLSASTNPIRRCRLERKASCSGGGGGGPTQELAGKALELPTQHDPQAIQSVSPQTDEEILVESVEDLANQSIWNQIVEIAKFTGPATGLWLCGPLMSLIDTAIIGQASSIELAALGPATVLCDNMSYMFMFLSIATSNMVATSLARQDVKEVQRQISTLLFVGLICGLLMLLFTKYLGAWALTAFTGAKNLHLLPAANTYVQIRGLAWPSLLIGWVAQSASLGMKDSWGPLKALAAASIINLVGDVILCSFLGYGIAGAAWATAVSQIVAGFMMIDSLNKKGYNAFAVSVPSPAELLQIFILATPVLITIASKVAFYTILVYCATSMGTNSVAAHQVMLQTFFVFAVWGEPLSQTAQSFMPELIYGVNRSLAKARMLLKSLLVIGASMGMILGAVGTLFPWLFPNVFTPDPEIIREMHKVLIPLFMVLVIAPSTHSCEGTLLAGRDLRFISLSMAGCFAICSLLALIMSSQGFGLLGCWCALMGFQWVRFFMALRRLLSSDGFLFSEDLGHNEFSKLKPT